MNKMTTASIDSTDDSEYDGSDISSSYDDEFSMEEEDEEEGMDDVANSFSQAAERNDVKEVQYLVQRETRQVQQVRCVVLFVVSPCFRSSQKSIGTQFLTLLLFAFLHKLLAAACLVSSMTFLSLQSEDVEDFETSVSKIL